MKKTALLLLVPGLVLASLGVGLAVLMGSSDPNWTCSCENKEWNYLGPDGPDESRSHLDATGHTTSCERTDSSAKLMDRVFGFIIPGHEA
jgi:hypothetical protein